MAADVEPIKALAQEAGYADCGTCGVEPFEEYRQALEERIRRFPETERLYAPMFARVAPREKAPWAKSIVVCIRRYGKYRFPGGLTGHIGRNYLADNRYKGCPDHEMTARMTEGLKSLGLRVRKGGVPDRWAAVRAGVARFGRNTFVYSEHGSWINVETWLTDAELTPDAPTRDVPCPDGCRACMEACPTRALAEPFLMRMDRCIGYLTYRAPEPIPADLWSCMGAWIYGCDRCQDVCPLNKGKWEELEPAAWQEDAASHLAPAALAEMDEETYRDVVHPRFSYIPLENPERWRCNARRALQCMERRDAAVREAN